MKFFWREVNNKRGKSYKTSNIDGFSDPKKITNIFLHKFLNTDDGDDESGNVDKDINQQILIILMMVLILKFVFRKNR